MNCLPHLKFWKQDCCWSTFLAPTCKGGKLDSSVVPELVKLSWSKNWFTILPKNTVVFQCFYRCWGTYSKGTTLLGNERIRRYRENSHGIWSDEWTTRSTYACCPYWFDNRRILPWWRPRCASLYRQYSVSLAGSEVFALLVRMPLSGRWLPNQHLLRKWVIARAYHINQEGSVTSSRLSTCLRMTILDPAPATALLTWIQLQTWNGYSWVSTQPSWLLVSSSRAFGTWDCWWGALRKLLLRLNVSQRYQGIASYHCYPWYGWTLMKKWPLAASRPSIIQFFLSQKL